jgi:hypothetical protein
VVAENGRLVKPETAAFAQKTGLDNFGYAHLAAANPASSRLTRRSIDERQKNRKSLI